MAYRADGDGIYTGRAFVRFLTEMPPRVTELTVLGASGSPTSGRAPYRLPNGAVRFVALPYYRRISSIGSMLRSVAKSCHVFAAELDRLDAVWVFGPQPMAVLFAWLARWRGKPLILAFVRITPATSPAASPDTMPAVGIGSGSRVGHRVSQARKASSGRSQSATIWLDATQWEGPSCRQASRSCLAPRCSPRSWRLPRIGMLNGPC